MQPRGVVCPHDLFTERPNDGLPRKLPSVSLPKTAPPPHEEPEGSNLSAFSKRDRVIDVNAEIPHRVLNIAMTKQYLNSSEIAGGLVD